MTETLITIGLTTLFAIVGFFLVRFINHTDKLADSINKLQLSITGLNGIIKYIKEDNEEINRKLDEHDKRILDHCERLAKLEK